MSFSAGVNEEAAPDRIAIVGMSCRFPGARGTHEFWRNLREGRESVTFFSDEELLEAGVPRALLARPEYVRASPILGDVSKLDAAFFGLSPAEATRMDPQHRFFLTAAYEALEDAGYAGRPGARVGVFGGATLNSYMSYHGRIPDLTQDFLPELIGCDKDFLCTRVAHALDLSGPAITVQTACSTSLTAVHLACQSILNGESDMALAGGVSIRVPQRSGYLPSEGSILSEDGHCRAFDAAASGTLFGSGVGVVALKSLAAAQRDGDRVYAVILGSAVNNDGSAKASFTAPSTRGQAEVVAEALAVAGVDASEIGYVECHGTGTLIGDPIEVAALTEVYRGSVHRKQVCPIGSVKSNVGHLEHAAGVASLIKAALTVYHDEIPPSLHFQTPNPRIDFPSTPFFVNTSLRPLADGRGADKVAVTSLGAGGTNVHLILGGAPREIRGPSAANERGMAPLLLLSAKTAPSLASSARAYATLLRRPEADPAAICASAALRRPAYGVRGAIAWSSREDLVAQLDELAREPAAPQEPQPPHGRRGCVFVYSGHGSQWLGMGRDLARDEARFRESLAASQTELMAHADIDLHRLLHGDAAALNAVDTVQPVIVAVQIALTDLLRERGVRPSVVLGHSLGEIGAAYGAGILDRGQALRLAAERGRVTQGIPTPGAVALLNLDERAAAAAIAPYAGALCISAQNDRETTMVSGDAGAIDDLVAAMGRREVFARKIDLGYASHSPHIEAIREKALERFAFVQPARAETEFRSTSSESSTAAVDLRAPYWFANLRSPVHFAREIERLIAEGHDCFFEVGGHGTLTTSISKTATDAGKRVLAVALQQRQQPGAKTFYAALGRYFAAGGLLDATRVFPGRHAAAELPLYSWQESSYWFEPRESTPPALIEEGALGHHVSLPLDEDVFQSQLCNRTMPVLEHHVIYDRIIVPGAMYLARLLEYVQRRGIPLPWQAQGVYFPHALALADGERVDSFTVFRAQGERLEFEVKSQRAGQARTSYVTNARGSIGSAPRRGRHSHSLEGFAPDRFMATSELRWTKEELLPRQRGWGLRLGPQFHFIEEIGFARGTALARLRELAATPTPPGYLDTIVQVMGAAVAHFVGLELDQVYVPLSFDSLLVHRLLTGPTYCLCEVASHDELAKIAVGRARLLSPSGEVLLEIENLEMVAAPRASFHLETRDTDGGLARLYVSGWRKVADWPPRLPTTSSVERGTPRLRLCLGAALPAMDGAEQRHLPLPATGPQGGEVETLRASLQPLRDELRGRAIEVWLSFVPGDTTVDVAADGLPQAVEGPANVLVGLLRALMQEGLLEHVEEFVVVTARAHATPYAGAALDLRLAALLGQLRSLSKELDDVRFTAIDLEDERQLPELAWWPRGGLGLAAPREYAIRGKTLLAPCLSPARTAPPLTREVHISRTRSYVVAGGSGALGLELCRWLVQQGAGTVFVLGRAPEAPAQIEPLATGPTQVVYLRCDLAVRQDVQAAFERVRAHAHPLAGVFHTAGVLRDKVALNSDRDSLHEVYRSKVGGAWWLHRETEHVELDFFVLYSSVVSRIGSAGQSAYGGANAFLDGLAAYRSARGLPALSINWGPWDEVGMFHRIDKKLTERTLGAAILPMSVADAMASLARCLTLASDAVTVAHIVEDEYVRRFDDMLTFGLRDGSSGARAAPATAEAPSPVVGSVRERVYELLRQVTGHKVLQPEWLRRSLLQIGVESLAALELRNRIKSALGISVPIASFFKEIPIESLVASIADGGVLPSSDLPAQDGDDLVSGEV